MLKRLLHAVDCGITAFINDLYPFKVLTPPSDSVLTADDLHCAAGAVRCWVCSPENIDAPGAHIYSALADRLSAAAAALTPVSN